jgi:diguanylate cyclase (GGDEF)-like protein
MERSARTWRTKVTAVGSLLCIAVAAVDHLSGFHVSFLFFYILPIATIGWRAGAQAGVIVAIVAGLAWYGVSVVGSSSCLDPVVVWNAVNRGLVFLAVAVLSEMLGRQSVLAKTDELTGLPNRRSLLESLRAQLSRSQQAPSSLCVAYLDLDNFKQVNDRFGHAVGDALLKRVADVLRVSVRLGDLPARIGGDEFVVVCWRISPRGAWEMAERLADRIVALGRDYEGAPFGASIGLAHFSELPDDPGRLLDEADRALMAAKAEGKQRVVFREVPRQKD